MTDLLERAVDSKFSAGLSTNSVDKSSVATTSECDHTRKVSLCSSLLASNFFIFESPINTSSVEHKVNKSRNNGWVTTVKRIVNRGAMRRLQERILGTSRADVLSSTSEIWLLGTCYKAHPEESSAGANPDDLAAFLQDFSSRIWVTYRSGFDAIGVSKFTGDVVWGCMIRSSQMLVAQALLFHRLGRAWRKPLQKGHGWAHMSCVAHGRLLLNLEEGMLTKIKETRPCQWPYMLFQVMKMGSEVVHLSYVLMLQLDFVLILMVGKLLGHPFFYWFLWFLD